MTHLETYRAAFSGGLLLSDLRLAGELTIGGRPHSLYRCPCGGAGHHATRAMDYDAGGMGLTASPVLHCWETGAQWMVENDVETIIRREEVAYGLLLDRWSHMAGHVVTAAEAFRLVTEQGVPADILDIADIEEFTRLFEAHRQRSRRKPEESKR